MNTRHLQWVLYIVIHSAIPEFYDCLNKLKKNVNKDNGVNNGYYLGPRIHNCKYSRTPILCFFWGGGRGGRTTLKWCKICQTFLLWAFG
jgi:hypothetical protein